MDKHEVNKDVIENQCHLYLTENDLSMAKT